MSQISTAPITESQPITEGHSVQDFIHIIFQSGPIGAAGLNGCRIEDVIDLLANKLKGYQDGPLACVENAEACHHLSLAKKALLRRRDLRTKQGVLNTQFPHESIFENRTEDVDEEFSATGA